MKIKIDKIDEKAFTKKVKAFNNIQKLCTPKAVGIIPTRSLIS